MSILYGLVLYEVFQILTKYYKNDTLVNKIMIFPMNLKTNKGVKNGRKKKNFKEKR